MTHLVTTTGAKSLLFECCNTVTSGMSQNIPLVKLCVEKLRGFVEDPDQNCMDHMLEHQKSGCLISDHSVLDFQ